MFLRTGAELFAKRQKRSEKWVVEGPTQQLQQQQQYIQQQQQYESAAAAVPVNNEAYNPYAQVRVKGITELVKCNAVIH